MNFLSIGRRAVRPIDACSDELRMADEAIREFAKGLRVEAERAI